MATGVTYLNNELFKYGLGSTGNIQSDLAELKKAKLAKGESTLDLDNFTNMIKQIGQNGRAQQTQGADGTQQMQGPPWNSLMQSLGLQLQGSKDADFTAIEAKITQLESMSLSADQKASLDSLKAQFETIKKTEAQHHQHHKGQKVGEQQGQKPQGAPQGEPPWFAMMKNLGLQPQGSPQADFAAMQTKITQMQSTTLPADQKANLESLQAQLEQYKLQAK